MRAIKNLMVKGLTFNKNSLHCPHMNPTFEKIIVTHKCEITYSNGFIVSSYYDKSLKHFKLIANEVRKDFPDLSDGDIEIFVVTDSTYNKGCPGVRFALPANTKCKGYRSISGRLPFGHS